MTLVIAQNGSDLRIQTVRNGERQVVQYSLENPEIPKPIGTSGGGGRSIAQWNGRQLVTHTPDTINGMAVMLVERLASVPTARR